MQGPPIGDGSPQDLLSSCGNDAVESSVKNALREAKHLEDLALAQRAKARSLALAGALKNQHGVAESAPQAPEVPDAPAEKQPQEQFERREQAPSPVADSRPSIGRPFGRPFGRKD